MRIAHISDTHLGYRSATIPKRNEDFAVAWKQACRDIVQAKPDLVIHAGDVFHRPNPSWSSVIDFLEGAATLREADCPIVLISGNHDSSRLRLTHTVFSVLSEAVPFITISYHDNPYIVHLDELDAEIVLLSHQALMNPDLSSILLNSLELIDHSKTCILVAHGDIYDLESAKEQGSVVIPSFVFDYPWSYVALGHLHMAQPYASRGWYSGSIERCGWSDYPASPGWTLVTLSSEGVRHEQRSLPHLRFIQLPDVQCDVEDDFDVVASVLYSLTNLRVPTDRALARVKLLGVHPFVRRSIQFRLKNVVREMYPNLIFQVEMESLWSSWENPPETPEGEIRSIEDMFRDFVESRPLEDETLRPLLLEKGLAAIDKAQVLEDEEHG